MENIMSCVAVIGPWCIAISENGGSVTPLTKAMEG